MNENECKIVNRRKMQLNLISKKWSILNIKSQCTHPYAFYKILNLPLC